MVSAKLWCTPEILEKCLHLLGILTACTVLKNQQETWEQGQNLSEGGERVSELRVLCHRSSPVLQCPQRGQPVAAACTAVGQCTEIAESAVVESENMDLLEFGSALPLHTESDLLSSEREQLARPCLWAAAVEAVWGLVWRGRQPPPEEPGSPAVPSVELTEKCDGQKLFHFIFT